MIPRITRGSSAAAALAYDFGPGRREEHVDARTVAGNVPGTWRDQAVMIDETVAARAGVGRGVEKGIWRTSLRTAPEDRVLSDGEWGQIAEAYIAAMKLEAHPWTATRHGDDHIHLTVSRVSWSGKVASLSHDFAKAQAACRSIEVEHQLIDASARFDRSRPQVSHGERERAARLSAERAAGRTGEQATGPGRAQQLGRLPGVTGGLVAGGEREQLRELVGNATTLAAATGRGREGFEECLGRSGVLFRANVASTGRVSGYSYGLAGHLDAAGVQVFFKGSQLGKAHSWATTSAVLAIGTDRSAEHTLGLTPDRSLTGGLEPGVVAPPPVPKPGRKPADPSLQPTVAHPAQADRERLLAEHRAVVAQRRELTRERLAADADHRGALAALSAARRALEVASRSHRNATSQWHELARQVERTGIALAQAIAASREVSPARRAREQLAAPWAALGGRPTAAAQRQAAVQAAQERGEAARAVEVVARARVARAEEGLRSAQREVAAAQEQVDRTGQVAQVAVTREQRAAMQVTGWEAEQARNAKPSALVQQALERARGRGPEPGQVDLWRPPPGPSRGSGPSR